MSNTIVCSAELFLELSAVLATFMTGRGLLKDAVPENVIIYPVKTQYTTCKEGGGDYNHRRTTKENFGCYKNRFGEWMYGMDGVPEFSDEQDVPKNP